MTNRSPNHHLKLVSRLAHCNHYQIFFCLLIVWFSLLAFLRKPIMMMQQQQSKTNKPPLIVVAPTHYADNKESRFLLGLESCRRSAFQQIHLILVDGSPSNDMKQLLEKAGELSGTKYVNVAPQSKQGKKGVALREAIQIAFDKLSSSSSGGIIAFQELEKVDMFRHWHSIIEFMTESSSDVVAPKRQKTSFEQCYPIEQFHAEMFINMYLDSLGTQIGLPNLDWTISPIALDKKWAKAWLKFDGSLWDAQLVPLVGAHLQGARVSSYEIDYHHPRKMKQQEEGKVEWNEKRLMQANFLKDAVGKEIIQQKLNFLP